MGISCSVPCTLSRQKIPSLVDALFPPHYVSPGSRCLSFRGKDDSATSDGKAWLKQHSWDSNKDLKMKAELKKMYHKGINAISKSIASEAAEENNNSFFSKWAGGKSAKSKGSKGRKNPLSDKDMKLYKQAESRYVTVSFLDDMYTAVIQNEECPVQIEGCEVHSEERLLRKVCVEK